MLKLKYADGPLKLNVRFTLNYSHYAPFHPAEVGGFVLLYLQDLHLCNAGQRNRTLVAWQGLLLLILLFFATGASVYVSYLDYMLT